MRSPSIHFFSCSCKGRRKRNEDYVAILNYCRKNNKITVAVIADGMGGYEGGHIASKLAAKVFLAKIKKHLKKSIGSDYLRDHLIETYQEINRKLYKQGQAKKRFADMGTTLTALILIDRKYQIAHIGDTRAYVITKENISQITEDHSAIAEALKGGLYSPQEIANLPYKNAITRNLGNKENIAVDVLPDIGFLEATQDQIFLLITDGIFSTVSELELYESVISTDNIKKAVRTIINLAYKKGSKDNLSVVILELGHIPRKHYLASNLSINKNTIKKINKIRWLISSIVIFFLVVIYIMVVIFFKK